MAARLTPSASTTVIEVSSTPRLNAARKFTSGAWLNPYMTFTAAEVAAARFLQLQCRGKILNDFELKPVLDAKAGRPHADFFLLHSPSIMPEAERDATTIDQRETDAGGWRELGALTYNLTGREPLHDFNRTAENWASNHLPFWIVSQRVPEVVTRRRFKGWGYLPVLEKGTPLHAAYTRLWEGALERVAANPRNFF